MFNVFIFCLLLFIPLNITHAYIDPGAGSNIIQVVIASIVGGLFGLKLLWQKFINKIRKR